MGKGRAPCCDKTQVKRGPWSPAEDLKLIAFIQKYGHENWRALPKQAGNYISFKCDMFYLIMDVYACTYTCVLSCMRVCMCVFDL